MKLMFFMMNGARIEVGLQGSAAAAGAYQAALAYAKERLQSRSWKEWDNPAAPQVPIIEHPDVRRLCSPPRPTPRRCAPCSTRPRSTRTLPDLQGRGAGEVPLLGRGA